MVMKPMNSMTAHRNAEHSAIWKFELREVGINSIEMPKGAEPLSVGQQGGQLVIWAVVNLDAGTTIRHFRVVFTGKPLARSEGVYAFLGTVQMPNGLVMHVFEVLQ